MVVSLSEDSKGERPLRREGEEGAVVVVAIDRCERAAERASECDQGA
jgi:hypothetical protein